MIEVGQTTIHAVVASALVATFLSVLIVGQALQWTGERPADNQAGTSKLWSILTAIGHELRPDQGGGSAAGVSLPARVVAANRVVLGELRSVDDTLDHESVIGRFLRPAAQRVLSGWLGAGNEQAYCGREGWLFYRPDVEYLTAPGFLEPARLARRAAEGDEWVPPPQPDPRPAIRQFARQLEGRGITLVIMPTPVKPMIHPEKLARRDAGGARVLQNPSFDAAVADFRSAGALIFDPSDALRSAREATGHPQYLATDTHWRPETMGQVAGHLAEFVRRHVSLPAAPDPGFRSESQEVKAFGDLRRMLDLPASASIYPPETVTIRRVLGPDGSPWRPVRSADVLVLGDSFSNIYTLGSMGWGESAGFVEQLSLALERPVDRIVENDDGAFATRARLQRELASGADRLSGKRVVIYQFSARELTFGDWKLLPWEPTRRY